MVRDAEGNLYGTTVEGGYLDNGTVFKVDVNGKETVLHRFRGSDGSNPFAGIIRDSAGNLYGTTYNGGSSQLGTVFKVDANGKETVLYSFTGDANGAANPAGGLLRDAEGNLYGTTEMSGICCGTVFKVDANAKETMLHRFTGGDGDQPQSSLVFCGAALCGTTKYGGAFGAGTVFKLEQSGELTVLYSFTGGVDGYLPVGGVIRDPGGNLYGMTYGGGDFFSGNLFKVDTSGKETVLYSFTGGEDGAYPGGGVIRDSVGNLYGTTSFGGDLSCNAASGYGCGTVFKLAP